MAADTPEKRFSAMNIACPWRGLNVRPSTIDQAERQAVMYLYSGIVTGGAEPTLEPTGKLTRPTEIWLARVIT